MDIKVQCPCGQLYEFEVEPVDGKMPVAVQCPTCGVDGTELANKFIATNSAQVHEAAGVGPSLRVAGTSAPPVAPTVPAPTPSMLRPTAPGLRAAAGGGPWIGVAGAVVGGLVGMLGWYLLIKTTGFEIGYAAWGVGWLTGFAARRFVSQGSPMLGGVAGACAFLAIIGGQYLVVKSQVDVYADRFIETAYQNRMTFANSAVRAKSDDDLRSLLAREKTAGNQKTEVIPVTDEELGTFRNEQLPKLEAFTKGKPSESEFKTAMRAAFNANLSKASMIKESLGLFTLLWLFLGVGTAYKLGAVQT